MATTPLLQLPTTQPLQPHQQMALLGPYVHYQQVVIGNQQPMESYRLRLDSLVHYKKGERK
jgi:hypothetical protein